MLWKLILVIVIWGFLIRICKQTQVDSIEYFNKTFYAAVEKEKKMLHKTNKIRSEMKRTLAHVNGMGLSGGVRMRR